MKTEYVYSERASKALVWLAISVILTFLCIVLLGASAHCQEMSCSTSVCSYHNAEGGVTICDRSGCRAIPKPPVTAEQKKQCKAAKIKGDKECRDYIFAQIMGSGDAKENAVFDAINKAKEQQ